MPSRAHCTTCGSQINFPAYTPEGYDSHVVAKINGWTLKKLMDGNDNNVFHWDSEVHAPTQYTCTRPNGNTAGNYDKDEVNLSVHAVLDGRFEDAHTGIFQQNYNSAGNPRGSTEIEKMSLNDKAAIEILLSETRLSDLSKVWGLAELNTDEWPVNKGSELADPNTPHVYILNRDITNMSDEEVRETITRVTLRYPLFIGGTVFCRPGETVYVSDETTDSSGGGTPYDEIIAP